MYLRKTIFLYPLIGVMGLVSAMAYAQEGVLVGLPVTSERQSAALKEDAYALAIEDSKKAQQAIKSAVHRFQWGPLEMQYGASASTTYRYYKDIDNERSEPDFLRWSWEQILSGWLFAQYEQGISAYMRITAFDINRGVGPTYTGIGNDFEGPDIDMAYVQWDLLEQYDLPILLTAGRHFQYVGRGLAYSAINDGVQIQITEEESAQKYFVGFTPPRTDNIDFSVPGFDKEGHRSFLGGEFAYFGIPKMTLYTFALIQMDGGDEHPVDANQDYNYDSRYYGVGGTYAPTDKVEVWSEMIFERGEGKVDLNRNPSGDDTDIEAFAFLLGAKYYVPLPTKPILEVEYAHGSGDDDRTLVTNTLGGDLDGLDTNFNYFGYYQAGYALQPRLSNLNIYSVGASFQPLEMIEDAQPLAVGMKYYVYLKDKAQGGISDFEATSNDAEVGEELDLYVHWKLMKDWLLSVRYGIFYPAEAFPLHTQDNTYYFYSRLSADF